MCIAFSTNKRSGRIGREIEDVSHKDRQPVLRSQEDTEREYFKVSARTWEVLADPNSSKEEQDRMMEWNLRLAMTCPNAPSISAVTLERSMKKTMDAAAGLRQAAPATPAVSVGPATATASKKNGMGKEQELIKYLDTAIKELEHPVGMRLTEGVPSTVTVRKNRLKRVAVTNASAVEVRAKADNQKGVAANIKDVDDFLTKAIAELEGTGVRC